MNVLETSRMGLREINGDDAAFFFELANTQGWLTFIGDRNLRSAEDSLNYLRAKIIPHYARQGFGMWLVVDRVSGEPLGICGLVVREGLGHPDVGFAFMPHFQGHGYATEAVKGTLDFALSTLGLNTLLAIVQPGNRASIRVLEKTGFYFDRTLQLDNETLNLYVCRLPE